MKNIWVTVVLLLSFQLAWAEDIPRELAGWQDWVKYNMAYRDCPYFSNRNATNKDHHVCAWPQTLNINVGSKVASFSLTWRCLVSHAHSIL